MQLHDRRCVLYAYKFQFGTKTRKGKRFILTWWSIPLLYKLLNLYICQISTQNVKKLASRK